MSRTSCRENTYATHLLGYFRGVRDWFPQGTFDEVRMKVVYSYGCGLTHGTCVPWVDPDSAEAEPRPGLTPGCGP